jgi:hypothetical protein
MHAVHILCVSLCKIVDPNIVRFSRFGCTKNHASHILYAHYYAYTICMYTGEFFNRIFSSENFQIVKSHAESLANDGLDP